MMGEGMNSNDQCERCGKYLYSKPLPVYESIVADNDSLRAEVRSLREEFQGSEVTVAALNLVLREKEKHLAALRGFARSILDEGGHMITAHFFGLIDSSGNPTDVMGE
jgi:hypothetical protein